MASLLEYNYLGLLSLPPSRSAVVECPLEPLLELRNGYPRLPEGRLGLDSTVTFACNESYRLVQQVTRTCQTNGTWSNHQPYCESE